MHIRLELYLSWIVKISIILLLFTPLIVTSQLFFPFVTEKNFFFRAIVEIVFGAWLGLALLDKHWLPQRSVLLAAFAAFVLVLGIVTVTGVNPYRSFWSSLERMDGFVTYIHLFMLFITLISLFRVQRDWFLFWTISLGVSMLISLLGIFEILGILTPPGSGEGRIVVTLGNPIFLASYLLFHMFLAAFLCWVTPHKMWRAVYLGALLLEGFILLFTGTRGALLGLMGGIAVTVMLLVIFGGSRRVRLVSGGLIIGGIIFVAVFLMARTTDFVRSSAILSRFADIGISSSTAQSRLLVWGIAWDAFKARPLLGWGPDNFVIPYTIYYNPDLFGSEPWFDRVHNMHLEWLVAGGIIGFAAYGALFWSVFYALWRLWKREIYDGFSCALLAGLCVAYLIQNMFVFDTITTYIIVVALFGFLHTLLQGEQDQHKEFLSIPVSNVTQLLRGVLPFGVAIILVFVLHVKPLQAAHGIISMIKNASVGNVNAALVEYDYIADRNTFVTSEARIQLFDLVFKETKKEVFSEARFRILLDAGITEIRDEVSRGITQDVRPRISLAKLLQFQFALTGNEDDFEESIALYQESIAIAPRFPAAYIGLAETYLAAGHTKEAMDTVDRIYQEVTRPSSLIYAVLLVHAQVGDFDNMIVFTKRYISWNDLPLYKGRIFLEPEKLARVIERSFANNDAAGRKKFLEYMIQNRQYLFKEGFIYPFVYSALAETEKQLGNKENARAAILQYQELMPADAALVEEFLRGL